MADRTDDTTRDTEARIAGILRNAADRIDIPHLAAQPMTEHVLRVALQLATWDHHGIYNGVAVGRDILRAMTAVAEIPLDGTRGEYATRLRLHLGAVSI